MGLDYISMQEKIFQLRMMSSKDVPDINEMTATVKLSYSEIHRISQCISFTEFSRDDGTGPKIKGLRSLRKDIQDIKKQMDSLYHNKIIDRDKAPDTIIPKKKCKVCED